MRSLRAGLSSSPCSLHSPAIQWAHSKCLVTDTACLLLEGLLGECLLQGVWLFPSAGHLFCESVGVFLQAMVGDGVSRLRPTSS